MQTTRALLLSALAAVSSQVAVSQTASSVQSAARPFNLDIVAPVMVGGSDSKSADFMTNALPSFQAVINSNLNERQTVESLSAISLDPSALVLSQDATVRAYFVSEGAGYHNSLGFSTQPNGDDPLGSNPQLIFPDASSNQGFGGSQSGTRTSNEPLLAGDFVEMGKFAAGTKLDFFLIANGANGGTQTWSTTDSNNADGIVHAVSLAPDGSAFLLIGFEDLPGGGDKDYNDTLFALEIGVDNVKTLGAPEPSLLFGALLTGPFLLGFRRRIRR